MPIKWSKEDVIKKFQEAMTPQQGVPGQRPNVIQGFLDRARAKIKGKPTEGEEQV